MAALIIAQRVSAALVQEMAESNIAESFGHFRRSCASSKHRCRGVSVPACRASLQLSRICAGIQLGGSNQTAASYNKPLVPTRNGEAPLLAAQRRRWTAATGIRMKTERNLCLRVRRHRHGASFVAFVRNRAGCTAASCFRSASSQPSISFPSGQLSQAASFGAPLRSLSCQSVTFSGVSSSHFTVASLRASCGRHRIRQCRSFEPVRSPTKRWCRPPTGMRLLVPAPVARRLHSVGVGPQRQESE